MSKLGKLGLGVAVFSLITGHAAAQERFDGKVGMTNVDSTPYFPAPVKAAPGSPNIIYIVLDDVGFSDLGSYGSEIATPNMDRLAAEGLRFSNFHSKAICSATRASLLTGRNNHAVGVASVANQVSGYPRNTGEITKRAATIAEILRARGYATYGLGKWHLVSLEKASVAGPFDQWPVQRGFDRYYGFLDGLTDQFEPELIQDNSYVSRPNGEDYHLSEDLADHAANYVRSLASVDRTKPFFLYLAFGATHVPIQAPASYIAKYADRYHGGWEKLRAERFERQKATGLLAADTKLGERDPAVPAWDSLSSGERLVQARMQAAYAGFLEHTDAQIGRVMAALKETGQAENTIIVLLSDNGGAPEGGVAGSLNELGHYATYYVKDARRSPEDSPARRLERIDEIGSKSSYPSYSLGWTMASNTPFRFYKQSVWDGGTRVPLIISWPKGLKLTGATRGQFIDVIDVTPTILDLVDIDAPARFAGIPQMPVHGASFAAAFMDPKAAAPRDVQYYEMLGQRAIRWNNWFAIAHHPPGTDDFARETWSLFDIVRDPTQSVDLARRHPETLRQMQDRWWVEATRYDALPLDGRTLGRVIADRTAQLPPERLEYHYYQGQDHLPLALSPYLGNRPFTLEAVLERKKPTDEGVILSQGGRFDGFAFFVKDGRLTVDVNDFGRHMALTSDQAVPVGRSAVRYHFRRTGDHEGIGTLEIDGRAVGSLTVRTTPTQLRLYVGTDVGRSSVSPVSPDYAARGAFAFPASGIVSVRLSLAKPGE